MRGVCVHLRMQSSHTQPCTTHYKTIETKLDKHYLIMYYTSSLICLKEVPIPSSLCYRKTTPFNVKHVIVLKFTGPFGHVPLLDYFCLFVYIYIIADMFFWAHSVVIRHKFHADIRHQCIRRLSSIIWCSLRCGMN